MTFGFDDIPQGWREFISGEAGKEYFRSLSSFLDAEYSSREICPPVGKTFRAFGFFPPSETKAVIIAQDPYSGEGQADGLAFSVPSTVPAPPSLRNIVREIENEFGAGSAESANGSDDQGGRLACVSSCRQSLPESWARQGVLLLNSVMTVRCGAPLSHRGKGWEMFARNCVGHVSRIAPPSVFMLWGNHARTMRELIDSEKHLVIENVHPSPLSASRGFFGSGMFVKANAFLAEKGRGTIRWI